MAAAASQIPAGTDFTYSYNPPLSGWTEVTNQDIALDGVSFQVELNWKKDMQVFVSDPVYPPSRVKAVLLETVPCLIKELCHLIAEYCSVENDVPQFHRASIKKMDREKGQLGYRFRPLYNRLNLHINSDPVLENLQQAAVRTVVICSPLSAKLTWELSRLTLRFPEPDLVRTFYYDVCLGERVSLKQTLEACVEASEATILFPAVVNEPSWEQRPLPTQKQLDANLVRRCRTVVLASSEEVSAEIKTVVVFHFVIHIAEGKVLQTDPFGHFKEGILESLPYEAFYQNSIRQNIVKLPPKS